MIFYWFTVTLFREEPNVQVTQFISEFGKIDLNTARLKKPLAKRFVVSNTTVFKFLHYHFNMTKASARWLTRKLRNPKRTARQSTTA